MLKVSYSLYLFIFIRLAEVSLGYTPSLKPPASDFKEHRIVQPIVHHARTKREILTTRDMNGAHHSDVIITVPIDGQEYILDLHLNQDLITDNHVLSYQKDGKTVVHKPKEEEIDLCHYGGTVRNKPGSWVAVSTCHGVQGIVFDGQRMRYIEPAQGEEITSHHYVYDQGDLLRTHQCGVTNSSHRELHSEHQRHKRHTILHNKQVYEPYNANKLSRYVELVLVADNKVYQSYGRDLQVVHRQMKALANMLNSLFAPVNIFIALVGVVVWTEKNEIEVVKKANETLKNFSEYRRGVLNIPNDNAQLLTGQELKDMVGLAYVHSMCNLRISAGIVNKHSEVIGTLALTMAHEMGHNLGMEHDTDKCKCPSENCIMESANSFSMADWSSCSLDSLTLSFFAGLDYCLRNKPKSLFDSPTCGNGFVEPGEQCDCGTMWLPGANSSCHSCCEPSTCKLRANATCGAGTCCDLQTCRPMSAGTVCRGAERECDLPEYCTGHSEFCPDDVYKMDTTPCGKAEQSAYCMRGGCHSHSDQCRLLWGTTGTTGHNKCYSFNEAGSNMANCGYNNTLKQYKKCSSKDALCGRLQCIHADKAKLHFGKWSFTTIVTTSLDTGSLKLKCSSTSIDLGANDVDFGLVSDGAKCGEGMMCMNQECVSVAAVRETIAQGNSSVCPSDCSGHGVCNSEGHCHCEAGFAPPLCALPGSGGSGESGPSTNPTSQYNFMVVMYAIFLGIIPSIVLVLLFIYCFCPTIRRCQKSQKKNTELYLSKKKFLKSNR